MSSSDAALTAGAFDRADRNVSVVAGPFVESRSAAEQLVVGASGDRPVYLRNVATVLDGPQEATREMTRVYQQRRDVLMAGLRQLRHLEAFTPQGAFYVWARIADSWPGHDGQRDGWAMTHSLIDQAGIGSAPGEVFGPAGAGHLRFAFSCSTEQIERAAALLPGLGL